MPNLDELERYEQLMGRLVTAYRTRIVDFCKASDLTPPQFWALKTIHHLERTKMSPLADELGLSMGAVSTLVDRLVSRELVERRADELDRRAVYVSLTPKGHQALENAIGMKRELMRSAFMLVSPEMRERLLDGLQALSDTWESLPAPQTSPHSLGGGCGG